MKKILSIIFILLSVKSVYSQCSTTGLRPSNTTYNSGTDIQITSSAINTGGTSNTYYYDGAGSPLTNTSFTTSWANPNYIVVKSGKLIISSLTIGSGGVNIFVASGATLEITLASGAQTFPSYSTTTTAISNWGTLKITGNSTITDAKIFTASSTAKTTFAGNISLGSASSYLYNNGTTSITGTGIFTATNPSPVCLEGGSYLTAVNFDFSSVSTPLSFGTGGVAYINYTGSSASNRWASSGSNLTSSSSITVCGSNVSSYTSGGGCSGGDACVGSATKYAGNSVCSNPLPIIWGNVKATKQGNSTQIKWTTLQELNNDYFIIEKSRNGLQFESVAKVKGVGNSNIPMSYNTEDFAAWEGLTYYRIKQVDKNGDYEYSSIFTLTDVYSKGFVIYPNPVDNSLKQLFVENHSNDHIFVTVYNDLGQIISLGDIKVSEGEIIDVFYGLHNLSSGIYEIKVATNNEVHVEKVIIK